MKFIATMALLLPLQAEAPARDGRLAVQSMQEAGETLFSVSCDNVPLYDVVRELAAHADADVDGFQEAWRKLLVTVDLRRRPLRQTLAYLLGSVELAADVRQGAIYIRPVERPETAEDLRQIAVASYQLALRQFPQHELVPRAEQRLGELEEQRGDRAAARKRYTDLVERHPEAELVPAVMMRLGALMVAERDWQSAAVRYEDLLRFPRPHPYQIEARTELLRCLAHGGDFERGLDLVESLDLASPASTLEASVDRRLLRARCLAGLMRGRETLAVLDEISQSTLSAEERRDYLEVRATACESAEQPDQAARTWLSYSRETQGAERLRGLESAARIALAVDDTLGVLFVEALAKKDGIDSHAIDAAAHEARTRMSLDTGRLDAPALLQRIERGERLLAAGMHSEGFDVLRAISKHVGVLGEKERARYARTYAGCLAAEVNVDAAVAVLRETLAVVGSPEERRSLFLQAGELLERHDRLDEAIEAYRGKL